ncbi:MAG: phytanoyl-CoA dioxygenase family protein [Gemmatimonadetes bacterium]|jgi:non-haem Fe2+, alpha-ketoglutarate-dependent halogenase|nr:phytanoyl-CoA dioxygenase family protein [Gemmatimonadota bacterium]MBT6147401.1 phytanoyl-CoA dioxygenase family protein [Gemmatimonadota bacterium]MBT7864626.1 phytanoyl-CoA dioxygenase family protein [Gemmatimonadota bacterium]
MNPRDAHPDLKRDLSFFPTVNDAPRHLTGAQVRQYNERGYIFPLDVYNATEVDANRAYFDELMKMAAAAGWDAYSINGWQAQCAGMYDMIVEPRILDYLEDLLGTNLVCWGAHFFCKMPGDVRQVSWHQDASYWPLSPSKTVTVWLAIDDADVENGAMTVIPGSHVHGQIDFDDSTDQEHNVLNQTVNDATAYGDEPVALAMRAGQISLHTDLLLHGSEPNRSDRRRCGLTMRFVPPDVHAHDGWNRRAITCRGSDPTGHWPHTSRPEGETIPVKS